jgi:hypothetical protein
MEEASSLTNTSLCLSAAIVALNLTFVRWMASRPVSHEDGFVALATSDQFWGSPQPSVNDIITRPRSRREGYFGKDIPSVVEELDGGGYMLVD